MMFNSEPEYTENDIERQLRNGDEYLKRLEYDKAVHAYEEARKAALAVKKTRRLDELDRLIRRAQDQAQGYAAMTQTAAALADQTDVAVLLEGITSLTRMIGQYSAMEYQELAHLTQSTRQSRITTLPSHTILALAEAALEQHEYELTMAILHGIQTEEDSPAYKLLQKARWMVENKIAPRLEEAQQLLTQGRPLDGLGFLQDLRRDLPGCPSWRKLWLELCRKQGEHYVEQARQSIAEAQYHEAITALKKAYQAFDRGIEAYPLASSVQMLLTEVRDLGEITQRMQEAHTAMQAQQEAEAYQKFKALAQHLTSLADQGREYSLIQYGVQLHLERLQAKLGPEALAQATQAEDAALTESPSIQREDTPADTIIAQEPKATLENAPLELPQVGKEVELLPAADVDKTPPGVASSCVESATSTDRFMQWVIEVEPVLAQARAAFMRNDLPASASVFDSLARALREQNATPAS